MSRIEFALNCKHDPFSSNDSNKMFWRFNEGYIDMFWLAELEECVCFIIRIQSEWVGLHVDIAIDLFLLMFVSY